MTWNAWSCKRHSATVIQNLKAPKCCYINIWAWNKHGMGVLGLYFVVQNCTASRHDQSYIYATYRGTTHQKSLLEYLALYLSNRLTLFFSFGWNWYCRKVETCIIVIDVNHVYFYPLKWTRSGENMLVLSSSIFVEAFAILDLDDTMRWQFWLEERGIPHIFIDSRVQTYYLFHQ